MRYRPTGQELAQETRRIADALDAPTCLSLQLECLYAAPLSPPDGMIVYADGTVWDPGSGEGVYCYYGAAWNLLG